MKVKTKTIVKPKSKPKSKVSRSAEPFVVPEPLAPIRTTMTMVLPAYLANKFPLLQHIGGKIDGLAGMVLPEDSQRYDVRVTVEIVEARPITV